MLLIEDWSSAQYPDSQRRADLEVECLETSVGRRELGEDGYGHRYAPSQARNRRLAA